MHEQERAQLILKLTRERLVVPVRELIARTGVSSATIRRDLTELAEAGLIRRVHGGVQALESASPRSAAMPGVEGAGALNYERKRAIARAAVDLCEDDESIIIHAGSTTYQMVAPLAQRRLHILTNSFPIASALLAARTESRIVLPGGEICPEQGIVLSPFEEDAIQHYAASKLFMSCFSLTSMGVIEDDPLMARAEAKLLKRAQDLILLVDGSKFETRGSISVCPLTRVKLVITDAGAPPAALENLRAAGGRGADRRPIAPRRCREGKCHAHRADDRSSQ
ncbi:DeoR/GlpR family DNA-binding transcription regulator [Elstera litoralis]|uniref:DeoR/GlpR family DNA-binding transcription regulator n=1 Tax=Elstera litoralis TaxID=552518 RepID=UPI000698A1B7|nr:DeoR/GlpR family DNA-binding transcription regulator [Elstera litoralis]